MRITAPESTGISDNLNMTAPFTIFAYRKKGAGAPFFMVSISALNGDLESPQVVGILDTLLVLLEDAAAGDVNHDFDSAAADLEATAV